MHVEGERGGATVAADLGRDHGVSGVIGPLAAMRFGRAQGQQARVTHVVVIGKRELRVAVELRGTGCELLAAELPG